MRGSPAPLKNSVIALLCRPELTVGTAVPELGILNAVGYLDPQMAGAKWEHTTTKGQFGPGHSNGEKSQSTKLNSLTWAALWFYSVAHDLPRSKRVRKPSKFLLGLYKEGCHRSNDQKSTLNHKNRELQPFDQFPDLSH